MAFYFLLLLLLEVNTEEVTTPASLLGPRNFNHHAYDRQFPELPKAKTTKQGPVLFPNDAPPPPRPPLIVTSRPLIESIARSELNQEPIQNNSIAEQSQINRVSFKPNFEYKPSYLTRVNDYKAFGFPVTTVAPYDFVSYANVVKKPRLFGGRDNRYGDYEGHTVLPPIYKAISNHAEQKVLKLKQKSYNYDYQVNEPTPRHHQTKEHLYDNYGDDEAQNYAFSYRVKDQKTGDDFSHSQQSSGSATNGEYRVRLPDGRMQIVSYTADENGYKADVRYDDEDKTGGNSIDYRFSNKNNDFSTKHTDYGGKHNDYGIKHNDYGIKHNDYDNKHNDFGVKHNDYDNKHNDFGVKHNDYSNYRPDYTDYKTVYNQPDYNENRNDYNDNTHDYIQNREYKPVHVKNYEVPVKDFNQYSDVSKEYYNTDYSLEYDGKNDNYEPHRSKFNFASSTTNPIANQIKVKNIITASTVKPSYNELKPLFVTRKFYKNPVEIKVPSTTPGPFEDTTENVVIIGTKPLYTNVRNIPLSVTAPSSLATPRSYLVSTIANLKNRIEAKPVLSNSFIDRINKYLTFN